MKINVQSEIRGQKYLQEGLTSDTICHSALATATGEVNGETSLSHGLSEPTTSASYAKHLISTTVPVRHSHVVQQSP